MKRAHNDTQYQNSVHREKQSYRLWWGAADQCIMPHGTNVHNTMYGILNYTIEKSIWNQTGKNIIIISSNTPSWSHPLLVCMSLKKANFNYLKCSYNVWYVYSKWSTQASKNEGSQEERHYPTHRYRGLFLDMFIIWWGGCASAMGAI